MFAALKKLFSKPGSPPPAAPVEVAPPAQTVPVRPAAPAPVPAATSPVPLVTGDMLHLPLSEILLRLPPNIAPLILSRPTGSFSLPLQKALEQLHTGAVRIPFAQLRQGAPPGTFASTPGFDETLIDLPLGPILAAVGPAALPRRSNQTRIDVPETVTGVFGAKGGAPAAVVPTPVSRPAPTPVKAPELPKSPISAAPSQPQPLIPARPTTSIAQAPQKAPVSAALPFAGAKPAAPLPFATTRPSPPPTTPAAPPPLPAAGPVSTSADDTIMVELESVSPLWAESVRHEIAQLNLTGASISIPLARLETGMKTGRVVFSWTEVRGWISPSVSAPSTLGETPLEFPLKVLAPLFISKRRPAASQKKMTVGENIPDLFAGLNKPTAVAPPASAAPPAAAPAAPAPAVPAASDALGEIFGQPSKTDWTAQEIAQRISSLEGVAATLITTLDGLLVAGEVPGPWKAETLAGFFPQMFARMTHYSTEADLGTLHSLTLNAGQASWAIFTAGPLFLAVLGQHGRPLPEGMLHRIAGELAKRNP